jgi:uncharacterized protein YkwD
MNARISIARLAAAVVVIGALVFGAVVAKHLIFGSAATTTSTRALQARVLTLMNVKRAANGLPPLHRDASLERLAVAHSVDELEQGYFAHSTPSGGTFALRMRVLRRPLVGENLAWGTGGFGTPAGVVAAWMASPEHRKILLDRRFRRVGVGIVLGTFHGQSGARIVTADFSP